MFLEVEKERWIDMIRMWMNEYLGGAKKGTILQLSLDSMYCTRWKTLKPFSNR